MGTLHQMREGHVLALMAWRTTVGESVTPADHANAVCDFGGVSTDQSAALSEREKGEGGVCVAWRRADTGWHLIARVPEAETAAGLIAGRTESSSPLSRSLSVARGGAR